MSDRADLFDLFRRACELGPEERERLVAELEQRDAGLGSELRELLASDRVYNLD